MSSGVGMVHRQWCVRVSEVLLSVNVLLWCLCTKNHASSKTRAFTRKDHYVVMYRLIPSGFLFGDRKVLWKESILCLTFRVLPWRVGPDLCGSYPLEMMAFIKIQLHTKTFTSRQCQIQTWIVSFRLTGVVLCSPTELGQLWFLSAKQETSFSGGWATRAWK